jgi:hypothetical protein
LYQFSFQNQGVNAETVQVSIDLPAGLVYQADSASAPGTNPQYDANAHRLTWTGSVGGAEQVLIRFLAAAQPGYAPGEATITARVVGVTSGQTWEVPTTVRLNLYGLLLPLIRR